MSTLVNSPFTLFTDRGGNPLESGYIFIGKNNQNPEVSKIGVFWDESLTIPAEQPIRTLSGYPSRSGTPSAIFIAEDDYSIIIKDKNSVVVFSALSSPRNDGDLRSDLASPDGASMIGYGGVTVEYELNKLYGVANVKNFGAIGDGVANEKDAFIAALTSLIGKGGMLIVPPGKYHFGSYTTSQKILDIVGLNDVTILAYGAEFIVNTTTQVTPFLFCTSGGNNWSIKGAKFFDEGFNSSSWLTHSRWGMGAFLISPTDDYCSGFHMEDCEASNLTYLMVSDQRSKKRMCGDFSTERCNVKNAYYGVDLIYAGGFTSVDLECEDVRRGFVAFGQRDADIRLNLKTTAGFLGSNAFVSLACEGEAYDDASVGGVGVIGDNANSRNIRVAVNVSGVEAHESYVHLYQQQLDSIGKIENVDISVMVNNLTSVGKNPALGATNIVTMDHEAPGAVILGSTSRRFADVSVDIRLAGVITGVPVSIPSINNSIKHTVSLSDSTTRIVDTSVVNTLSTGIEWLSPVERPFTGINAIGSTSAGVATGLAVSGSWSTIGKRFIFNIQVSWSSHTGTGNLIITGLPKAKSLGANAISSPGVSVFNLGGIPGRSLFATIGGSGNNRASILNNTDGTITSVAVPAGASSIQISGSYVFD